MAPTMLGHLILQALPATPRKWTGKGMVLAVTYLAYATATAARLPYSICKTNLSPDAKNRSPTNPGWAPFTNPDGQVLLGTLDTVFMAAYAAAMPFMGGLADRWNQPIFLSVALVLVGAMLVLFGLAHAFEIHAYWYFVLVTLLGGTAQSICYPCVISVIAKWCGQSNMGLILGVWSSCTPIGTIVGKVGSSAALATGWWMAFIGCGVGTACLAVVVALFLVSDPYEVSLLRPGEARRIAAQAHLERTDSPLSSPVGTSFLHRQHSDPEQAVGRHRQVEEPPVPLATILKVPGMIAFCVACFFSKLAYYAFVFWLPTYLDQALHYPQQKAGTFSTFFDMGGFTGGILGGLLIDRLKMRAPVLIVFQLASVPLLFFYDYIGRTMTLSDPVNAVMLFALGFTVTTPYSLITSVMSTYLGKHPSLNGNSRATGTVTAILDGVGSFGAVLQGLVIGAISKNFGWNATFIMLMCFSFFSALCLVRPTGQELRDRRQRRDQETAIALATRCA